MANAKSPLVVMGGSPNLIYQSFTENGDYEASDYGADGFAGVVVDVPPTLFRQLVDGSITSVTAEDLNGVTIIGSYAFYHSQISSISFPNTITTIGADAFNATRLTSIKLPNSVTTVETGAFGNLTNTCKEVIIGNGIESIGSRAFSWLSICKKVIINCSAVPVMEDRSSFNGYHNEFYVPTPDSYKVATNWSFFENQIFPLVATVADLANIDTTTYTKACVIGVDESYKEYTYDGSTWNEVV